MSPFRPDIVDVWVLRLTDEGSNGRDGAASGAGSAGRPAGPSGVEILLLRRASGRILPGLWQCVSGSLDAGESITDGALRELVEETGFGRAAIEAFYDLDQVNQFHEPTMGGIVTSAIFAVRVGASAAPAISAEHDAMRWVSAAEAFELAIWPAYRESIRRIEENLVDPARSIWFELTLEGRRAKR